MGQKFWLLLYLGLSLLFFYDLNQATAYVPTMNSAGKPIRWKGPIQLNLAGNYENVSGLSKTDFFDAVVLGLQRWKAASQGTIEFNYWQGNDTSLYPANSEFNGISSIYFVSQSKSDLHLASNVLGMTQVWYNTQSGEILETDIVLNDHSFNFTNHPSDTSGYGAGKSTTSAGKNNVFIQNVLTHEIGHALGLSHSGGLQSTMLFMESPEQAHLGCDEQVAIRVLYNKEESKTHLSSLSGKVISESGAPVFGAHILAISQLRGNVMATGISGKDGQYTIAGLEPGTYFIVGEPYYAGPQALPTYFAESSSQICDGKNFFFRSFLTFSESTYLFPIQTVASLNTFVPTLTLKCNPHDKALLSQSNKNIDAENSFTLNFQGQNRDGFGIIDLFGDDILFDSNKHSSKYYQFQKISGHLEIHVLAYSLYSPVHASMSLIGKDGLVPTIQITDPAYQGDSGYINFDSTLVADNLPLGDYYLKVSGQTLDASQFPAGAISLDPYPFLVLTASNLDMHSVLSDSSSPIPSNARCRMEENFPNYKSPVGSPAGSSRKQSDNEVGFCGVVSSDNQRTPPGNGPPISSVLGWLLPWTIMLGPYWSIIRFQRKLPRTRIKT